MLFFTTLCLVRPCCWMCKQLTKYPSSAAPVLAWLFDSAPLDRPQFSTFSMCKMHL